jgi:hypothetical protein
MEPVLDALEYRPAATQDDRIQQDTNFIDQATLCKLVHNTAAAQYRHVLPRLVFHLLYFDR